MSATEILAQIRQLAETERRELVARIEEEFGDFADDLTADQIAELERRGERLRRNPAAGIPLKQVRAEMKDRIKSRSCLAK
jgi:putative addiction module component (TIGR02574 family)